MNQIFAMHSICICAVTMLKLFMRSSCGGCSPVVLRVCIHIFIHSVLAAWQILPLYTEGQTMFLYSLLLIETRNEVHLLVSRQGSD